MDFSWQSLNACSAPSSVLEGLSNAVQGQNLPAEFCFLTSGSVGQCGLRQASRTQHIPRCVRWEHIVSKLSHLSIQDFFLHWWTLLRWTWEAHRGREEGEEGWGEASWAHGVWVPVVSVCGEGCSFSWTLTSAPQRHSTTVGLMAQRGASTKVEAMESAVVTGCYQPTLPPISDRGLSPPRFPLRDLLAHPQAVSPKP